MSIIVILILSIVLSVCRGLPLVAQRRIFQRRGVAVKSSLVNDFSLLFSAMTEDERNFELLKLFAPSALPLVFIGAYTAILIVLIKSDKESTEKSIASNKESTEKLIAFNKEISDQQIKALHEAISFNKESLERYVSSNKESLERAISSNKEVAGVEIKALHDATDLKIKAFESKFDQFYDRFSRNLSKND